MQAQGGADLGAMFPLDIFESTPEILHPPVIPPLMDFFSPARGILTLPDLQQGSTSWVLKRRQVTAIRNELRLKAPVLFGDLLCESSMQFAEALAALCLESQCTATWELSQGVGIYAVV